MQAPRRWQPPPPPRRPAALPLPRALPAQPAGKSLGTQGVYGCVRLSSATIASYSLQCYGPQLASYTRCAGAAAMLRQPTCLASALGRWLWRAAAASSTPMPAGYTCGPYPYSVLWHCLLCFGPSCFTFTLDTTVITLPSRRHRVRKRSGPPPAGGRGNKRAWHVIACKVVGSSARACGSGVVLLVVKLNNKRVGAAGAATFVLPRREATYLYP